MEGEKNILKHKQNLDPEKRGKECVFKWIKKRDH